MCYLLVWGWDLLTYWGHHVNVEREFEVDVNYIGQGLPKYGFISRETTTTETKVPGDQQPRHSIDLGHISYINTEIVSRG
jgi:hypothetical protein